MLSIFILPVHPCLKIQSGLEERQSFRFDGHRLACFGVPAGVALIFLHKKGAQAAFLLKNSFGNLSQKFVRRKDGYASKLLWRKMLDIAGDDVISSALNRALQKLIIRRIILDDVNGDFGLYPVRLFF